MGTVISKAANGIGATLAATFVAPIKTIFGASCKNMGFNLFHRAFMRLQSGETVNGFRPLLYKEKPFKDVMGCLQDVLVCIRRCQLFSVVQAQEHEADIPPPLPLPRCRRRISSSKEDSQSLENYRKLRVYKERRSVRERRKDRMQKSLHPMRHRSKGRYRSCSGRRHVRWQTSKVSVRVKDLGRARIQGSCCEGGMQLM